MIDPSKFWQSAPSYSIVSHEKSWKSIRKLLPLNHSNKSNETHNLILQLIKPFWFILVLQKRGLAFSLQKQMFTYNISSSWDYTALPFLDHVLLHLLLHFPLLLLLPPSIQMLHSLIIFKQSNQFTIGWNLVLDRSPERTQFRPIAAAWVPKHPSLEEVLLLWILFQSHEALTSV